MCLRNYFNELSKTAIREKLDPRNISTIRYIFGIAIKTDFNAIDHEVATHTGHNNHLFFSEEIIYIFGIPIKTVFNAIDYEVATHTGQNSHLFFAVSYSHLASTT